LIVHKSSGFMTLLSVLILFNIKG